MFALLMGIKRISPAGLQQAMRSDAPTIIDVNSQQSWTTAHLPGAINLDPNRYTETDLPQNKSADLVFYCSNPMCRKAPIAARRAKKLGYTNVRVLSAGITGWQSASLPTESGIRPAAAPR